MLGWPVSGSNFAVGSNRAAIKRPAASTPIKIGDDFGGHVKVQPPFVVAQCNVHDTVSDSRRDEQLIIIPAPSGIKKCLEECDEAGALTCGEFQKSHGAEPISTCSLKQCPKLHRRAADHGRV